MTKDFQSELVEIESPAVSRIWQACGKKIFFTILIFLGLNGSPAQAASPEDKSSIAFFDSKIHPILEKNCYKCHGAGKSLKGGFRLTSREGLLKGADRGPAINTSNPADSVLLEMISYKDEHHEMPPKGKLKDEEIKLLKEWIAAGAPYNPAREIAGNDDHHEAPKFKNKINDETRNYWAFRKITNPKLPKTSNATWSKNPIDAFILNKLDSAGLTPNDPASRQQLIRRAYYDLIGLPPTPAEVKAFQNDTSPDAWKKVITHLLSSPQYGVKWGRHWLDLVHYADTNGYERDNPKPEVWRYRDYVINAFNKDKPYDQFLTEQLAGDEIDNPTPESLIATGYQRLGIWDDEPADPDQAYYDYLDDVVGTTSQVFMGLTVNCARCHSHKIDPIPQADYYRLMAFFHNTLNNIQQKKYEKTAFTLNTTVVIASEQEKAEHRRKLAELKRQNKELESKIRAYEKRIEATFNNPEKEDAEDEETRLKLIQIKLRDVLGPKERRNYQKLVKEFEQLKKEKVPPLARALYIKENGRKAPDTHLLIRGNAHVKGDLVQPGFPQVLGFQDPVIPEPAPNATTSGRRKALAEWLTRPDNPLTARVIANRIWQYHFGRGIVRSSSDFGQIGERPTHPELLDWLASYLIKNGWSLKTLHRQIMLSNTYQMSSKANDSKFGKDPRNDLIWRFDIRRLTAEEIRDSILSLTGKLNLKMGGKPIYTEMPPEVLATASRPGQAWGKSSEEDQNRRSAYVYLKRSLAESFLKSFDSPDTDSTCAVRFATTVPTQSLTMLNSKFMNDMAETLANRLEKECGPDLEAQITKAFSLAFSRQATADEIEQGAEVVRDMKKKFSLTEHQALERFCLLTLNLNEFVFLD